MIRKNWIYKNNFVIEKMCDEVRGKKDVINDKGVRLSIKCEEVSISSVRNEI